MTHARAPRVRTDRDGGYVLIEALAVLALSGLIMVAMASGARLLLGNWARAAEQANRLEELETGLAVVRRDVAGAEQRRWGEADAGGILFRGSATGLSIAVSHDGMAPGRGASVVAFNVRQASDGAALVRSAGRLLPGTEALPRGPLANPVNLVAGAFAFRFSYRALAGGWRNDWTDAQRMPAAVRLEVIDAGTGDPAVPPLIVPFRVDAEAGCAPDSPAFCGRAPFNADDPPFEQPASGPPLQQGPGG